MAQARHATAPGSSLNERLAECAREARKQAQLLPDGPLRNALLQKARDYEAQISVDAPLVPGAHETKR